MIHIYIYIYIHIYIYITQVALAENMSPKLPPF